MAEMILILWFTVLMCTICGFILGFLFGKFKTLKDYENKHPVSYDYVDHLIDEIDILNKENIDLMKTIAQLRSRLGEYNDR